MIESKGLEVWFVTGSQHLYGKETLKQIDGESETIANAIRYIIFDITFMHLYKHYNYTYERRNIPGRNAEAA
jgi:hypothetical protein